MIQKLTDIVRNKISDKMMVILGISSLGLFYYIGLLSYITNPFKALYKYLLPSSNIAVFLRALTTGLICLYSILVVIKYKPKIKWSWFVMFVSVLVMTLLTIIISPLKYNYMFVEELYKVVHVVELNPGIGRTIVMYLSSIADFAFAFCILFIMPIVINDKKKLLYILAPIVIIALLECVYSIIKEKDLYIYIINHPDDPFGGYSHDIGATFGNKEDWGAFLTIATCVAVFTTYSLNNKKRYIIFKIILIISICVFAVFAILSLCKTAMLSICLLFLSLLIGFIYSMARKSKKSLLITMIVVLALIMIVALFFVTKGFGIVPLQKVYNLITQLVIEKAGHAIEGRAELWLNYLENVRGYNLFFGMGKANVNIYTKSLSPEGQSTIHNGFAYFFASYGLIGFMVLLSLLCVVIFTIIKLWRNERWLVFILFGIMAASFSFILAEAEVLLISTSAPVVVYNILLVILPAGLVKKYSLPKEILTNEN